MHFDESLIQLYAVLVHMNQYIYMMPLCNEVTMKGSGQNHQSQTTTEHAQ